MRELICGINEADPGDNRLFAEWQGKLHRALAQTKNSSSRNGVLIETAAQHPLKEGRLPNEEFSARLEKALDLYLQIREQSTEPVKIYVPGSVHMYDNQADAVSLSEAGCLYLLNRGIPKEDLFGDDANALYKGTEGVYNSSDECYVALRLFEALEYGRLCCVCSPAQLHRKALSYIEFGHVPEMYSVPVDDMFHNYVDEIFLFIPRLLVDGNGLQDNSEEADRLRKLRKPRHIG